MLHYISATGSVYVFRLTSFKTTVTTWWWFTL